MTSDPFALFDEWFAEAKASEPNDPDAMALATADVGRQSVGSDGPPEGSRAGRFRVLHQRRQPQGHRTVPQSQCRLAVPLEDAAPPGADRRPGRARARRRSRRLLRDALAGFAARRLGVGPVAVAGSPRDDWKRASPKWPKGSKASRCRARRIGRAAGWCRRISSSGRTAPTGSTNGACSSGLKTAGSKGCSTRERGPCPQSRPCRAFVAVDPRGDRQHRHGAVPARPQRLGGVPNPIDGDARLAGRHGARPGRQPGHLVGVRIAAQPADSDHRFGHGKAEALVALVQIVLISLSAVGIAVRSTQRLIAGAQTQDAELGIAVSLVAMAATFVLILYQRTSSAAPDRWRSRPTGCITPPTCSSTAR